VAGQPGDPVGGATLQPRGQRRAASRARPRLHPVTQTHGIADHLKPKTNQLEHVDRVRLTRSTQGPVVAADELQCFAFAHRLPRSDALHGRLRSGLPGQRFETEVPGPAPDPSGPHRT